MICAVKGAGTEGFPVRTRFEPKPIWVCLKMLCTPKPNGFADHYPYEMAISLGIYPTFSDKPILHM